MMTTDTSDTVAVPENTILSRAEVFRRFPEIKRIKTSSLRELAVAVVANFPDYFWEVPASISGKYHNKYCVGRHGLWIHTKMVFVAYERMSESHVQRGRLGDTMDDARFIQDCGRVAVIVHDMFKQGFPEDWNGDVGNYAKDHDVLAAEWLRENTNAPDEVISAVESHMGPNKKNGDNSTWGTGKSPSTPLEELVHMADLMGSARNATGHMISPAQEILEEHPDIPCEDMR